MFGTAAIAVFCPRICGAQCDPEATGGVTGCGEVVDTHRQFGHLAALYGAVGVAVLVLVAALVGFVVVRFRARPGRPVASSRRSDAPRAELAYVLGLALIVVILLLANYRVESRVDRLASSPALRIDALASDWRWRFAYPGQGVTQVGSGTAPADLFVPADTTIEFHLTSADVIHAFYIAAESFQRQAIPRIDNRFDLVFRHPGTETTGACNEYCGVGHTQMHFEVHVLTPSAFAAWLTTASRAQTLQGGA